MNAKTGKKGAAEKAADKTDAVSHCEWPRFALGDVCDVQLGKMLSPAAKRGIRPRPYLRNANVQWDHIQTSDVSEMDFTEAEEKKFALQKGDLLVCEGGEPGRAAIWDGRIERCCYQKALHRLRAKSGLADSRFVLFRLWHASFSGEFSDSMSQSTIAHLPEIRLRKLEFRLPPLAEQQRIAARLREQLAAVETARRAVESQVATAEALPAAHLRAVFESTAESNWPRRRLGDVLRPRNDIVHPSDRPTGGARFVGLEHVQPHTGRRLGELAIEQSELTGRKARFFAGDIVYGYLRPYLNKVWIAEFEGLCSADHYVYRVPQEVADTAFIAWFLRSPTYLQRAPVGVSPGQLPRIRMEEVAAVELGLPPLANQRTIAARLDAELSATATLRAALEARLKSLEALPAALLREAFGESLRRFF